MNKEQKNVVPEETALVKPEEQETALAMSAEEINEMFGESSLDVTTGLSFNVVKIVRETAQFDMGNEVYEKSLVGHILFKHRANQWWEVPYDDRKEGDDPAPQCYSIDGVASCGGSKMQAAICSDCRLDKFGSAGVDQKGKACRNTMRLLFLQDGAVLPIILVAPPTSLGRKGSLRSWLNSVPNDVAKAYSEIGIKNAKGGPVVDYWPAQVELWLDKQKFSGDMTASVLGVKTLDVVTPKSDENKLRLLFNLMKETAAMYKEEQKSYMELDRGSDSDLEDTAVVENLDDDTPI